MTLPSRLIDLIARQSAQPPDPGISALCDALLARYGGGAQAILFYGSCLRSGDTRDGLVDLYLVVDNYRAAYGTWMPSMFNGLLPPNVYYLEVPFEDSKVRCKYAVVSLGDLRRGTSIRTFHSYLWGRFAQPSGIVYARNDAVSNQIHGILAQAVVTFITRVLPRLPEHFRADELWRTGLGLSYASELRTEKPGRVNALVDQFQPYYEALARAAMPAVPWTVSVETPTAGARYRASISPRQRWLSRVTWAIRRGQGKVLSVLRLMKSAFTFQGGVDYIAWKLERHTGVAIEVTPRLRRYPLIFIWGQFWRLYRRGVFR